MKRFAVLVLLSGVTTRLAIAQEGSAPESTDNQVKKESASEPRKGERMEVLGTHIKRIDVEGPSPVTTIEQEQIKQSGAESIGDVLRDDALNIFGSRREKSGGNFWSESSVELRGLGQARTLVLLNGKRLPRGGNWSVDLNIIPIAAVERVEILRDGASAIYGTDALGGVVNIITKKNFDGSAATIKALVPQDPGGQSKTLSYYQGVQLDKTQISFMLNFRDTDTVHWNQRKDILDTSKAYTDGGMPGNYVDARGYDKAFPNCPESNIVDSKCVDRYWEDSILQPSIQTLSFVSNFTHRLTDDLEVFGRAIVSRKNSEYQWGPVQPKNFFKVSKAAAVKMVEGLQINGVDYSTIFDAARSDRPITLKFAVEEAGPQKREGVADLFGLGLGVKGPIWDDFEWEVFVAADRTQQRDTQTNGAIKKSELIAKMEAGTYNPFKEYGERGAIDDIEFKPWAEVESGSREVNAKISGPLFELPAGTVQGAAGVIGVNEYFNADRDPQLNEKEADGTDFDGADFTGFTGTGNRLVTSAYAEVSVPVIERMELQLAARFDEYSDFGNTLNPKIGWRYAPVSWAYLRFSGGRGFRAPTLDELYRDEYPQFVTFTDAKTGSSMRMYIKGGGNKDLSPERSEAISYGLGLEPFAFMSVTADYWRMNLIDPISFSAMASLTQAEANGYDVSRFATITRDPITKDILDVVAPYQNMGRKEVAGYDLTSVLTQKTNGFGTFRLRSNHSVMLKYKTKDWPLDELTDRKGYGGSPRWRNNSSLGWSFDEYYASLSANTTAAQKSDPNRQNWVNYYTEYSSYLKYRAPWKGELSFGIVNLDNRKPPQNDRQPDINARLYSLLGRRFNLEYTQNF